MPSSSLADIIRSAAHSLSEKNVHKLRTSIRRCEGVVLSAHYEPSEKEQQVLKRLRKVRKAAGEIRDIDIHLALLDDEMFQRPVMNGAPSELTRVLKGSRKEASRILRQQLKKCLDERIGTKAQKICKSAAGKLPSNLASSVVDQIRDVAQTADLNDAAGLHEVRIGLKKVRYALEASKDEAHKSLIDQLKAVHDAIGTWHDWVTLAEVAEAHLQKRSPLAIQARRRAASLFVKAIEQTASFFAPYQAAKKKPASATIPVRMARARA